MLPLNEKEMRTEEYAVRIRKHALKMTSLGKASHIGSILSVADILAVLYGKILNVYPQEPKHPDRDRLVLSKGHACAGIYAALAERGYFPMEWLKTHYANGSRLCGHVSHTGVPGVECSTGSLGHGLPIAAGMALAALLDGKKHRVFAILSDGECDEGSTWEAILFAGHHRLSNLIAIIDYNRFQGIGRVEETLELEPFAQKWRAFGWQVAEVDGHNHSVLSTSLNVRPQQSPRPSCIIAHTVKGKGVSFMENSTLWHYRIPAGEEYEAAMKELLAMERSILQHNILDED